MKTIPIIPAIMLSALPTLHAQLVADGATNTLSSVTNTITGDLTVGTNGSFTLLVLSNNALVTNSVNGVIGRNATARSNEVRLLSPSARWLMGNHLYIGSNGSYNRLVVSNGGTVRNNNGYLGLNPSSSNNVALVTGPGSVWSNANAFFLSFDSAGNQLIVSNSGVVRAGASDVGLGSSSSNNVAVVTGSGSLWSNAAELVFGFNGAGNQLVISNGGVVRSSLGYLGNSTSASNNLAVVTGAGSLWTNTTELYIAHSGVGNRLVVSDGGTVRNGQSYVGANFTASNNLALITGAGSVWSNALDLNIGAFSGNNQMIVSNGATVFAARLGLIGPTLNGNGNSATVTGPGSRWLVASNLFVGSNAALNRLIISDGGQVLGQAFGNSGVIGQGNSGSSNLAVVTGAGSLWSNAYGLYVGGSGAANQLVVSNGGLVHAEVTSFVGSNQTSSNNVATVTDSGSLWNTDGVLYIGFDGAGNRLVVSNGGLLRNTSSYVGVNPSSSSNLVLVTGSGSAWTNTFALRVGFTSPGNRLVVSNGGFVAAAGTVTALTIGDGPTSRNNEVLITGAGSVYSNAAGINIELGNNGPSNRLRIEHGGLLVANPIIGDGQTSTGNVLTVTDPGSRIFVPRDDIELIVGASGSGNFLVISNGAAVAGDGVAIGYNTTSSNNLAVVTGAGSMWSNQNVLQVGRFGPNNRLLISEGGIVSSTNAVNVGFQITTSSNNLLHIANGTLRVTNLLATGTLDIRRGTNVLNAGLIEVDRLLLTNAQGFFEFNGGTLITRGASISNGTTFLMGNSVTHPAVWAPQAGADHRFGDLLFVGVNSPFNQLLITNGATMNSRSSAVIGLNSGSVSNTVLLSGPNSRWSLRDLYVGYGGNHNRLIVTNGGFVGAVYVTVGGEAGTTNCETIITGPGSVLSNSPNGVIQIGSDGSTNRVRVENGGLLLGNVEVGRTMPSVGNVLSVTGPGSRVQVFTNFGQMAVGYDGSAGVIIVSNGAAVLGYEGVIGRNASSSNNLAVVTGSGSVWSNTSDLYIGGSGAGNRLEVDNGGVLGNYEGFLGYNTYSSNNQVRVTGSGSLWTNGRELSVGFNGTGNQLIITNGGTVFTFANKYVGNNDGALSNTVIVTDAGSAWLGDDSLYVGSAGSVNRLYVRNGGRMVNRLGTIGGGLGANGNQVVVTDAGSVWTNQLDVTVGENGSANTLVVSNGATLFGASDGFIGRNSGANSNTVILTDPGTRWLLSSNLYVGSNGAFSRLVISNGARLENRFAATGGGNSSSNNEVLITGAGSIWSNRTSFNLGESGRGNRLVVTNGGRVDSRDTEIGSNLSSSNNEVIVTGVGSFWRVQSTLELGSFGGGNRLVVSNGAWLHDDNVLIGLFSTNNEALVTGPGTTWTNRSGIYVGRFRGHNRLMIADGAFVFSRDVFVGLDSLATNNRVVMDGGTLLVTNTTGVGALDVLRGTNVLNAGLIDVARLFVTNALGQFEFNGGTLVASGTAIGNGRVFTVGNGASAATFVLRNGTHSFADNLVVASNASLVGSGTITGSLTVQNGGTFAPGASVGRIVLSNSPVLQGTTIMEISKNGATLANDQIQVIGALTYGGSLTVSNLGPTALTDGDSFQLFSASGHGGTFSTLTLPSLNNGLAWTNKLAVNGSIEVIGGVLPKFEHSGVLGTNVIITGTNGTAGANYTVLTATNITLPLSNWVSLITNQFGLGGGFSFTNGIAPGEPERYFRIRTP